MRIKLLGIFLFATIFTFAQNISDKELNDLKNSFQKDAAATAAQNILTTHSNIKDNVLNHELNKSIDHHFKYRVGVKGITNQKSSGRCWIFTSMNVLRPSIMNLFNVDNFDFSQNYLYFFDILEKSNLFLENIISTTDKSYDDREVVEFLKSPVSDGGVWNLYYNIAKKYGLIPESVMPETQHSNDTRQMLSLINEKLRMGAYAIRENKSKKENDYRNLKQSVLKDVYRILALCLGEPPTEFTWRFKNKSGELKELKYTPLQFYEMVMPGDYGPENYVMIMNDPTREYYKLYEIRNYRNTIEGINWIYLNLPNEDIKKSALASIKANEAMYASCDVSKQNNTSNGIMDPKLYDYGALLGVDLNMDKKGRILTRQSGSSHAMALIGCDTDENDKPVKWEFENSWGASVGNNGYLTFTDAWFDEYMFRLVIHRRYLDKKALDCLSQTPIQLPMWDYMN